MKKFIINIALFILKVFLMAAWIITGFLMVFAFDGGESFYGWGLLVLNICVISSYIYVVNKED